MHEIPGGGGGGGGGGGKVVFGVILTKYYLGSVALCASGRCCSQHIHSPAWLQAQCQVPQDTHHTPGQEGTHGKVSQWAGEGHSSSELQAGGRQPPRGKPAR